MNYTIDGHNLKEFGIYVSASKGVIDGLKLKTPKAFDWDGYHGQQVDLSAPRYDSREIELECWMDASGKTDLIQKANAFFALLSVPGTHRLMINTGDPKPLVYDVYWRDGISISKKWRVGQIIGTFILKLVEPDPVKRVLKWTGMGMVSITVNSPKVLSISWGDGAKTANVSGEQTITHYYTQSGTFYIIVAGVVTEISSFSTTAEEIWSII